MVYILLLLIALSVYCLLKSYINKYSWYFAAIVWSLIAAMYASFLLISASGNYSSVGYILNDLDRHLFLLLIANKIGVFSIIRIFNISTSVFLISLSLFSNSYFTERRQPANNKIKKNIKFIAPVFYSIFYDPGVVFDLYCFIVENQSDFVYDIICCIDLAMYIFLGIYMLLPTVSILLKRKKLITEHKKTQVIGVTLFIVLSDILYIGILRLFSLRRLYFLQTPQQLITIRAYGAQFQREYVVYPIIAFVSIIVLFITLSKFNLIRQDGIVLRLASKLKRKHSTHMMTGILHSVKGIIYSYKLTIDDTIGLPADEVNSRLNNLSKEMSDYIDNLTSTLNSRDVKGDFFLEECYLSDIIDDTLSNIRHNDNIQIVKSYSAQKEKVYADAYYMQSALSNIINNAVDAILQKGDSGTIIVSVYSEFDLSVISITDTGVGISKRNLKYIFNQFYTTKSRIKNWGIGLSFAHKIIKKHRGYISVRSRYGKGTTFDIILPKI